MSLIITTQWYREELNAEALEFYRIWREALRVFASGTPILLVHNGGPTDPPYGDVEIVPAVDMVEHERGGWGHQQNCWRSMCRGWEIAAHRGYRTAVFISQNLIVGAPFRRECEQALLNADVLYNEGSLQRSLAFTEYMAVDAARCRALFEIRYEKGMHLLEGMVPIWCLKLGLRRGDFPNFRRERDGRSRPSDTYLHFSSNPQAVKNFASPPIDGSGKAPPVPLADALHFAREKGIDVG